MTTDVATQRLTELGESDRLEFVASPGSFDEITQTVCAFLNTAGGTLVVGLDDSGRAAGTVDANDARAISAHLRSRVTPRVVFSVSLEEIEQGKVVVIEVPAGRDLPYVTNGSIYVRRGKSRRLADARMIREMVLEKSSEMPRWERRASLGLEMDGLATDLDEQLFEGPAFRLLDDVLAFLKRHIAIAAEFVPGRAERAARPKFPFNSLEEGIVNALVHRDYAAFSGSVSVSVYPDRVEIWNSGRLPDELTPKMLQMAQHASILINPDICHIFYLRGLMERIGRGTYKMVRECRQFGMRTPEWKTVASGLRLTLFAATGDVSLDLNQRQLALLEHIEPGAQIVTTEYSKRFAPGVSARQARRDLEELEDFGFLSRSGAGKGTTYTRTDQQLD